VPAAKIDINTYEIIIQSTGKRCEKNSVPRRKRREKKREEERKEKKFHTEGFAMRFNPFPFVYKNDKCFLEVNV